MPELQSAELEMEELCILNSTPNEFVVKSSLASSAGEKEYINGDMLG